MVSSLSLSVRNALDNPSPNARVQTIKTAVSDFFRSQDASASVRHTEYFNHGFAPDLVVTWPHEKLERLVFLRTTSDPSWLEEDLRWVASARPIILTLDSSVVSQGERDTADLVETAQAANTLVTDTTAMDSLSRQSDDPIVTLFKQAVFRGGRGVFDEPTASDSASTAHEGYAGAQRASILPTRAATDLFAQVLHREQAGRIIRLFQAVWEGNGGSVGQFPAQPGLSGPLNADDLTLLLSTVESDEYGFWRQIGRSLDLAQIAALSVQNPSENLQRLVGANLDRLQARAIRVRDEQVSLFEDFEQPHWVLDRSCLAFRTFAWTAYFAATMNGLPAGDDDGPPVDLAELKRRLASVRGRLTDIEVSDNDVAITVRSTSESGGTRVLDSAEQATGMAAPVLSLSIALSSGRRLTLDFGASTAGGHTNAHYEVSELGATALPLLRPLNSSELDAVESAFEGSTADRIARGELDFGE